MFSIGTGEIMLLLLSKASQSPVTFSSLDYSSGYRWSPRCSQCPLHLVLQIVIRSKRAVLQGERPIFSEARCFPYPPTTEYTCSQSISSVSQASWILLANKTQPHLWPFQGLFQENYSSLCYLFHYFVSMSFPPQQDVFFSLLKILCTQALHIVFPIIKFHHHIYHLKDTGM